MGTLNVKGWGARLVKSFAKEKDLATAIGANPSTVNRWGKADNRDGTTLVHAIALAARERNVRPEWILMGEGPRTYDGELSPRDAAVAFARQCRMLREAIERVDEAFGPDELTAEQRFDAIRAANETILAERLRSTPRDD